jgi:predicted secreted protein
MSLSLALAVYFLCWWIVLFAILPLKIGPQPKEGGSDPFAEASGAPQSPNIIRKFILTTIVSALIFTAIYVSFAFRIVTLDDIPFLKI